MKLSSLSKSNKIHDIQIYFIDKSHITFMNGPSFRILFNILLLCWLAITIDYGLQKEDT